jgi:hypothetical protein
MAARSAAVRTSTMDARKQASIVLTATPSECAAARRCPAPGGDSAGYRAPITETPPPGAGLYAFRKGFAAAHAEARREGIPVQFL